jgi:1-deoxy-D-xylulose-5-phosphate synthase
MALETIHSPEDLKKIPVDKLADLAQEIRQRIIEVVSRTGGHLASSLGAVELCIALHYCLKSPEDVIVWDVGHQAYAHKILTGRNSVFETLRQKDGISGFPTKTESPHDPFTTGHSSTAVSLALGKALARRIRNTQEKVVAVIGDGSLTGGMCFEALNHAGHVGADMLVVLNTNDMAIAPSVGALSTYLNKIISKPIYKRFKTARAQFLEQRIPRIGPRLMKLVDRFEEMLKGMIVPGIFFEEMGFQYFGPLDGHDIPLLVRTLQNILAFNGPIFLHVVTKKGKGFVPAEDQPVKFHGTTCFDIVTGEVTAPGPKCETFTDVFSAAIVRLAEKDKRIVAITAAMPEGTGLDRFQKAYPDRFFDVGIAEEHAVGMSAGLAHAGLKPFVAVYSTFLQRAYDQILEELCLQNLGTVLCLDRAGVVGQDGPTHHGIFDLAYLRVLPNITVMSPADKEDFEPMLGIAAGWDGPTAIRYPRDAAASRPASIPFSDVRCGKAEIWQKGVDVAIIAIGSMAYPAFEAAQVLLPEKIYATVVNARFAKPLDETLVRELYQQCRALVIVEEGVVRGGFSSSILEALAASGLLTKNPKPIRCLGLPNEFITFDTRKALLDRYGLNTLSIADAAKQALNR